LAVKKNLAGARRAQPSEGEHERAFSSRIGADKANNFTFAE
jgi:hypothetical protein